MGFVALCKRSSSGVSNGCLAAIAAVVAADRAVTNYRCAAQCVEDGGIGNEIRRAKPTCPKISQHDRFRWNVADYCTTPRATQLLQPVLLCGRLL